MSDPSGPSIPRFGRRFLDGEETFTRMGEGGVGGKAAGLDFVRRRILPAVDVSAFAPFVLTIPTLTVLGTELFDEFMEHNGLWEVALSGESDDRIAHAFQQGSLPPRFVGDLRALITSVHQPLAIRSSSLLEDALDHPFAGVYGTKMIPNNQADIDTRFRRLLEAIRFVWSTTFFAAARSYRRSVGQEDTSEKMAVLIQEVVGERHDRRFYPTVSGVARSWNYYPTGRSRSEEGVVNLALGLGRQIVDGGLSWTYCPAHPKAPPPFGSVRDRLENTQRAFWAVNMGRPPLPDPIQETEYLLQEELAEAERDNVLAPLVSTYDPQSDRLRMGLAGEGARVLDFAPLLRTDDLPLNPLLRRLLEVCEAELGDPVEIEFAVNLPGRLSEEARFGFLQMRPMAVSAERVEILEEELAGGGVLLATEHVLGNGVRDELVDVVFLDPDRFDAAKTREMALELAEFDRRLAEEDRGYLLIGFGRWGSSDPWLGIPVVWGQISHARVIVESSLPEMNPDLSQGSHFFHNLIGLQVLYLSVKHHAPRPIDWDWLRGQPERERGRWVSHVRCERPLTIKVDGTGGRGVILRHASRR